MPIELKIPEVGESVSEALIGQWFKQVGDAVAKDEPVVELETDKVTVELPSPVAGVLVKIEKQQGDSATVGDIIGLVEEGTEAEEGLSGDAGAASEERAETEESESGAQSENRAAAGSEAERELPGGVRVMPAARRALAAQNLEAAEVTASGPGGRLLKEDVERHVTAETGRRGRDGVDWKEPPSEALAERIEELVPMSPIRRRIAERLVGAQRNAALLTTFNEVDMSAVIALRKQYREAFEQRYGIKLGFMSFFVKACVDALRQYPQLNAEIQGTDILYRNYFDVGIAVSTDRGLMVPVVRNAERLGFSEIEETIADFGGRARSGKIKLEELEGGTFTITNGGIFGSMLSTPIVNPPQSGVLGLHAIEERPVAVEGEVVIRPMMYVALTYDHRIVDGREAVTFLRRIKETIEEPTRLLVEI